MSTVQQLDFSVDLLRAVLWQYNDATRLQSLLQSKQDWYNDNFSGFWNDWVRDVFDLRTANDFGLQVWAIILNFPLIVEAAPDDPGKPIWGFSIERKNFNNGNFAGTSASRLTTDQKRLILQLRYFQLVTKGTVPEINEFLAYIFRDLGPVYVADGLQMDCLYVFGFPLTSDLEQVISQYDLLPRPAGVKSDFVILLDASGWGFGRYHENFNNGNFNNA
jgi:hypothetical protein